MTDAQLEVAARKLCELEGLNPDHELPIGIPLWQTKKSDVVQFWRMCTALDHAIGEGVFP